MDYRKHVEYLPSTRAVLNRRLEERFGAEQGAALWEKTKRLYESFVADMPYTGGSKNPMCHSLYDSLLKLAGEYSPERFLKEVIRAHEERGYYDR
ncbi:MAG: hypothetical protein K2H37_12160 [Lachnospiraceae bacterium]|nr:hypothetical protein [Lachnospiraceae bacterium]